MTLSAGQRVLVYVVAFKAEQHLCDVFERIPLGLFNRRDVHFLVSDDASDDSGPYRLTRWLEEHQIENVSIIQTGSNQGYGGNQKIGYRAAIDGGFDSVILLHGDGQYAPELLPDLIEKWEETRADVILGSRMHSLESAKRGGMPAYKRLGNRLLTAFQNAVIGWSLSEYHTGYRLYSTAFLQSVPFETNTNDFHFDTEILLQAAYVGAKVVEVPIPTHYGNEVCRVPGLKYALNVVRATLQYKLHRMGMLCSLKLRRLSPERYRDKTELLYSSHRQALDIVARARPQRLLDIGCGPGHVAARCEELGARVTGIDLHTPPPERLTQFCRADLEHDVLPCDAWQYDVVLLLDVIEHLANPEEFLLALRHGQRPQASVGNAPLVVISTPNVAFIAIRLNLLFGRFNYAERGILDITHKRLFTRGSLLQLLDECGYRVERCRPVGVPFEAVIGGRLGRWLGALANFAARVLPKLFAFQFIVECRPHPGARQLLESAVVLHRLRETTELSTASEELHEHYSGGELK